MIINFEEYTHELTPNEKKMVPRVVQGLWRKVGEEKAVTNKVIVSVLKSEGYNTSTPRIRKIINFLRCSGIISDLVSTSKGYYRATTQTEIDIYRESLQQRIGAIQNVEQSIRLMPSRWMK